MRRTHIVLGGVYLGVPWCYRPEDRTICLGKEKMTTVWMHHDETKAIDFLIDVICHEEDHRIIHDVTKSKKTAPTFDYVFGYPSAFAENGKYFRHGEIDLFGSNYYLSSFGKKLVEKCSNKT